MTRRAAFWLIAWLMGLVACTTPAQSPPPLPSATAPQPLPTVSASAVPTALPTLVPTLLPSVTPAPQPPPLPQWENLLDEQMQETAVSQSAIFHHLSPQNSGVWQYDPGSFYHPIALEMKAETVFLLDGGRVLALDLAKATPPEALLQPGDFVEELLVQEPLDLALVGEHLLVLDRTGDVYRLALGTAVWQLERYERPIGDTSSHYFIALGHDMAGSELRLRLESSYGYAQFYRPDDSQRLWALPQDVQPVDVSSWGDQIYALWQNGGGAATAALFQDTALMTQFAPTIAISQPRQIVATQTAVYILDMAGRRLLSLQPQTGVLQAVFQLPPAATFGANAAGDQLVFAGQDRLYFWQQPENSRFVQGGIVLTAPQPHDTAVWQTTAPYAWPITGNFHDLTPRDLQMPGAPRHYRLGIHKGVDFYWANGTPVYAAASGTVIRALVDYERPSEITFNRRRAENLELGYTAPNNLDFYRGMQVWILQDDGFVARYAHLGEIAFGIEEGTAVAAGQQIGRIGNTGSPASVNSETEDAHLHFELWLGDIYLGQYLRPSETRDLVEQLFTP